MYGPGAAGMFHRSSLNSHSFAAGLFVSVSQQLERT